MCYIDPMIDTQQNILRGHDRFEQFVIPALKQNGWGGIWQNMCGTDLDRYYGIDYMYNNVPIAARIWDGVPKQHFAIRWYNTMYPESKYELTKLIVSAANNSQMPKRTIEAHTHNGKTYIAICHTAQLVDIINTHHPELPQFLVKNKRGDWAVFVRISFDLFPPDAIQKYIV